MCFQKEPEINPLAVSGFASSRLTRNAHLPIASSTTNTLVMSFDNSSSPTPTATNREEKLVTARSLTFVTLPEDILRLFFDAAFHSETQEDKQCRRTARNCCLASKALKVWVEPMLYQKVVLETSKQVLAFLNTMWLKRDEFLARAVKSIWILDKTFTVDMLYESYLIFAKCQSLDNFAFLGFEPCIRVLQNIPKPRNGRYKLRELAIMQPDSKSVRHFSLRYLSIQTLQFINNSKESFLDTLFQRLGVDEKLLDALRGFLGYASIRFTSRTCICRTCLNIESSLCSY